MARRKKEVAVEEDWLDKLGDDVSKALGKDCTQKELRSILVHSYIDFLKKQTVKDGGKVIETILKIAPAKADPVESDLEEPVTIVSHAEKMLNKLKKPVLVSSETILEEGEKEKINATITNPYRSGDPVVYVKEAPRDAMSEAFEEVATGRKQGLEQKFIREEYDPTSLTQEVIPGETMTMEEHMTFDQIRKNVEESSHEKMPRESTESVPEMFDLVKARSAAKRPQKKEPDPAREKAKRDWAMFQAKILAASRGEEE